MAPGYDTGPRGQRRELHTYVVVGMQLGTQCDAISDELGTPRLSILLQQQFSRYLVRAMNARNLLAQMTFSQRARWS